MLIERISCSFMFTFMRPRSSFIVRNQVCLGCPTLFLHGVNASCIGVSVGSRSMCPSRFSLLLLIVMLQGSVFVTLFSSSLDI